MEVGGTGVSLAATGPVAVAGSAVTLTLAAAVAPLAEVTVSYAVPSSDPVQDLAGNDAAGLTDRAVANLGRPQLSRATVGGATLVLFYDRGLDAASQPAAGDFTVTVTGRGRAVSGVAVRDSYVVLTLASAVSAGQPVTVSYTAGTNPIRDEAGTAAANFVSRVATDNHAPTWGGRTNLRNNAPSGSLVSINAPASDFSDADGDPLTFTVSADRDDVYQTDPVYNRGTGYVFVQTKGECELHYLTPVLPNPYESVVTLTATDPHGATAQVTMTFRVSYDCPYLRSATVNGATLLLAYSLPLDAASTPAAGDFTVKVNGAAVALAATDPVAISGSGVTLTLAAAVSAGQAVTVSYTAGSNPIRDGGHDAAADLTDQPVRNVTGDGAAPVLRKAAVDGAASRLTLIYDETLDRESVPAASAFTVKVDGTPGSLVESNVPSQPAVRIRDAAVELWLSTAVSAGQTVTVSYTVPSSDPIQDFAGNDAASLSDREVVNVTGDGTAPALQSAAVNGVSLVLTYDEVLDPASEPAKRAFTVKVNESEVSLAAIDPVAVAGSAVTLTLAEEVAFGYEVTASYTVPADHRVRDLAGNDAAGLTGQPVTNNTPAPTTPCAAETPLPGGFRTSDFTLVATASTIAVTLRSNHGSQHNRFDLCTEGSSTVTTVPVSQTGTHTFAGLAAETLYWVRLASSSHGFSAWKPVRTLPAAVSLALNSAGADGTYHAGEAIEATATFGESVTVSGTPRIAFTLGTETKHLTYASGSPGTALVFRYTVASGDEDGDGIEIAGNALENHGGSTITLTSDGTTAAALGHEAVAASASHKVDAAAPTLDSATVDGAAVTLAYDEALDEDSEPAKEAFTVQVNESAVSLHATDAVGVAGSAVTLKLAAAVSAGDEVTVSYTVPADDPIQDVGGNDAAGLTDQEVTNTTPSPPTVANAIANQPAVAGTAFEFTFAADTFSDANGDPLTYTATQDDGMALPDWLSFAAGTRTFSGTPWTADVGTLSVKVTASDGTDSVSDTFDIVVRTEANQVPAVANAIANQPAVAGTAFSFAFAADTFSDANGDTLSYTATQDDGTALPDWLSFAAGTRTFSGTPQTADVGTVTVKVTASDGTDSVSDTFDIVVRTEANQVPTVASAIANQTATAGTAFSFTFAENTFSDANSGDTLSYTATQDDGTALPAWLSFAAGTRTFSGTPRTADVGTLSVTVTADDGTHSVSDTFEIVVGADVTAPTVTISGVPASIESTAAFTVTFAWSEDVTGFATGDVTVSGGTKGAFTAVDGSSYTLTVTPSGNANVVVTVAADAATDGGSNTGPAAAVEATGQLGVCLRTSQVRDAIVAAVDGKTECGAVTKADLAGVTGTLNLSSKSISSLKFGDFAGLTALTGLNLSGNSLSSLPAGVFGGLTALTELNLTGNGGAPFALTVGVERTDGSLGAASPATLKVTVREGAPASLAVPLRVTGGTASALSAAVAGGGLESSTFTVTQASAGQAAQVNVGTLPSPPANFTGFTYAAADGLPLRLFENSAPTVAKAIANQPAVAGTAFDFTFAADTFSDANGDTLSYTATQDGGTALPAWLSFAAGTRTFSGTPRTADVGTVAVKVTADDGHGGSVSATFDIVVRTEANSAPTVASAIANQAAVEGRAFSFTFAANTFSDANSGDTLSYTATQDDGTELPSWLTFTASTRTFSGTPRAADVGTVTVKVTASDGTHSVSATFDIVASADVTAPTVTVSGVPASIDATAAFTVTFEWSEDVTGFVTGDVTVSGGTKGTFTAVNGSSYTLTVTPSGNASVVVTVAADAATDGGANTGPAEAVEATGLLGVCLRTAQVRDAIVAAVAGKTECGAVTKADLAGVTSPLNLSNKTITALKSGDFAGLTALTALALSDNSLSSLPSGVFDELTALTTLYLFGNSLSSLPSGVFDELTALTALRMHNNSLSSLPSGVFDGPTALTELYLHNNSLSGLPSGVFDGLTALTTLLLSGNSLSSLPSGVFDELTALTGLALAGNSLSSLPSGVFDKLTALTGLALSDNSLSSLPVGVFDELTALTGLALSGNSLSSLPSDVFDDLTALTTLLLQNNSLSSLPAGVFGGLTALTELNLTGNTGAPFELTVGLDRTDGSLGAASPATLKVTVREGAPASLAVPLTVTGATAAAPTSASVAAGGLESSTFTVTQSSAGQAAQVNVGALPSPPANFTGFTYAAADGLPLRLFVNSAPTVANAIANQPAVADTAFDFTFAEDTFSDADSDTLSYTATQDGGTALPAWLSFAAGTRTFSGTPQTADVGTVTVKVTADDGHGGSVSDTFDIVVRNEANQVPTVANEISDQSMEAGTALNFTFAADTFSDANGGDTLTYTATQDDGTALPSWLTFTPSTRTFSGTPQTADVGTVTVKVTASDGTDSVSDTFDIVVSIVPTISSAAVASHPRLDANDDGTNDTYGAGQQILLDVTWDHAVTWDTSASGAEIRVSLDIGGTNRLARLVRGGATTGSGTKLRFAYTVVAADADADGFAATATSAGALVILHGGATLRNAADLDARLLHSGLAADANHKVDGSLTAPANRAPVFDNDGNPDTDDRALGSINAPDGNLVSLDTVGSGTGFTDPDGDPLTYTFSASRLDFYVAGYPAYSIGRIWVDVKHVCQFARLSPPITTPVGVIGTFTNAVTLTASDPDGLSVAVTASTVTNFDRCPEFASATVNGATLQIVLDSAAQHQDTAPPGRGRVRGQGGRDRGAPGRVRSRVGERRQDHDHADAGRGRAGGPDGDGELHARRRRPDIG